MRMGGFAAGLLLLAGASTAFAQAAREEGGGLVGKEAPEIQTKEWINTDGRTAIADFRGEVVLLEAWATW